MTGTIGRRQVHVPPPPPTQQLIPPPPPVAVPLNALEQYPEGEATNPFDAFVEKEPISNPFDDFATFGGIAKPGPYITKLDEQQEAQFMTWAKKNKVRFDPSEQADYDMRGYWKDIVARGKSGPFAGTSDEQRHFSDTYKTPYHKTFSRESKYATEQAPQWVGGEISGRQLVDANGKIIQSELAPPLVPPDPQFDNTPKPQPLEEGEPPMNPIEESILLATGRSPQDIGASIAAIPRMVLDAGGKTLVDSVKTVKNAVGEVQRAPAQTVGSALAAIPAGVISVPQSFVNISNAAHRNWPVTDLFSPAGPVIDAATRLGNVFAGRKDDSPVQVKEAYESIPAVKSLLEANPASGILGELAGSAVYPLHFPGPTGVVGSIGKGVIGGGAFGTGMALEDQIQHGEQLDVGRAIAAGGLPGMWLGGTIGGAVGLAGKVVKRGKGKPIETESVNRANQASPFDSIELPDGRKLTLDEAGDLFANEATPPELKQAISDALDAHDERIATLGVSAEIVKPETPTVESEPVQSEVSEPVSKLVTNVETETLDSVAPQESPTDKTSDISSPIPEKPIEELARTETSSEPTQPVWRAEKSPDPTKAKQGYHDAVLIDGQGNELARRSSKRSLAEAQQVAEGLNSGKINPYQGLRDLLTLKKQTTEHRQQIVENGAPLPDTVEPELRGKLDQLADATHSYQKARAKFEAAHEAFTKLDLMPKTDLLKMTKKAKPTYIAEVEKLAKDALQTRPKEVGLEVQTENKLSSSEFKLPADPKAAANKVIQLYAEYQNARKTYEAIRKEVVPELHSRMTAELVPSSINVEHKAGRVNIRAVPKQKSPLEQEAIAIRARNNVPTETEIRRVMDGVKEFLREERGSAPKGGLLASEYLERVFDPKDPVRSIAEGAKRNQGVAWLASRSDYLTRLFSLRRTLDIVHDRSAELHNAVWQAISKETIIGRGIKFEPEQEPLVEKSLSMDSRAIRDGDSGLSALSIKQRNYLATRRAIRREAARAVRAEIGKFENEYTVNGDMQDMLPRDQHTLAVLKQLDGALTGNTSSNDVGTMAALRTLSQGMYDYVFKWNAPYHMLNLLDPLVVGSARVGTLNILRAKALLQLDPQVRQFIKGHEAKGPMDQLRSEARGQMKLAMGEKADLAFRLISPIKKLRDMVPDLPSESWNFQDALAASLIAEGNRIKYKGGGVQYLKDMAAGKLSLEQQVEGYTNALQATMDITGAGSFGLDRDPVQANPSFKQILQFTSQPYRVARLLKKWGGKAIKGDMNAMKSIATFAVISTLVAGRSVIPQEVWDVLQATSDESRWFGQLLQDALDNANVLSKVPVIGRDLSDKMRISMIPVYAGSQGNMMLEKIRDLAGSFQGQKWDRFGKTAFFMALSGLLGGGGTQAERFAKEYGKLQDGEEIVRAYPGDLVSNLANQGHALDTTTFGEYGIGDAITNAFLFGRSKRSGEFVKETRRAKALPPLVEVFKRRDSNIEK